LAPTPCGGHAFVAVLLLERTREKEKEGRGREGRNALINTAGSNLRFPTVKYLKKFTNIFKSFSLSSFFLVLKKQFFLRYFVCVIFCIL